MTFIDDFKKNIFYMLVLIFSIIIVFNTFNIVFDYELVKQGSQDYMSLSLLGFIIIIVSIVFIFLANSYYIKGKYKEYAIITLSGKSIGKVCGILIIRTIIVTTTAIILGLVISEKTSGFLMNGLLKIINIKNTTILVAVNALVLTFFIVFIEAELSCLINLSSIYRKSIKELVREKRKVYLKDSRKIKVKPLVYIILYLIPIICAFIPSEPYEKVKNIRAVIVLGVCGIQGIIRYVIPNFLLDFRRKKLVIDKYKLIIYGNLYSSIQKSILLMLTLIISTVLTISIAGESKIGSIVNIMAVVCYFTILVIMALALIYKFLEEARSRKESFAQLKLLGYTKSEIKKIIGYEVLYYYLIVIVLSFIYVSIISLASIKAEMITSELGGILIISYIAVFLFSSIFSYISYRKLAN